MNVDRLPACENPAFATVATKLAAMTCGTADENRAIVSPSAELRVDYDGITLTTGAGQVFEFFAKGLTYRQIADHVNNIMARGGCPLTGSVVVGPWSAQKPQIF